jgi:hypothetical protein
MESKPTMWSDSEEQRIYLGKELAMVKIVDVAAP